MLKTEKLWVSPYHVCQDGINHSYTTFMLSTSVALFICCAHSFHPFNHHLAHKLHFFPKGVILLNALDYFSTC